jgi:peptidoglycan/xylan/chitin deacetylase (PgdA/CDA1 family)
MSLVKKIKRKLYKLTHPELGVILMLHRVMETRSQLKINRAIEITPAFLEKTILDYQSRGFQFASLNDVQEIVQGKRPSKKPFVCFTFDDGYQDNFDLAYPIFKKHNCPFAIYVTTDFIEHKAVIWWYVLEDLLTANDEIRLSDGSVYLTGTPKERDTAFADLHQRISAIDITKRKEIFEEWFSAYTFSFEEKVRELSMNRKRLQLLAADPLCTIASHTVTHPHLAGMNRENQEQEMLLSKQNLEIWTGNPIRHFSYPFGSNDQNSRELAAKHYQTTTLAFGGILRKGFKDTAAMPREILAMAE